MFISASMENETHRNISPRIFFFQNNLSVWLKCVFLQSNFPEKVYLLFNYGVNFKF